MAYIEGKGEPVGVFYFDEIRANNHVPAIQKRKEETGLPYVYAEFFLENCVPKGLKFFLAAECDRRDEPAENMPGRGVEKHNNKPAP